MHAAGCRRQVYLSAEPNTQRPSCTRCELMSAHSRSAASSELPCTASSKRGTRERDKNKKKGAITNTDYVSFPTGIKDSPPLPHREVKLQEFFYADLSFQSDLSNRLGSLSTNNMLFAKAFQSATVAGAGAVILAALVDVAHSTPLDDRGQCGIGAVARCVCLGFCRAQQWLQSCFSYA
jgi:hypothetical protein